MSPETLLLGCILIAGFYMAWNIGANDVANALGTSVGSGALTLRHAVILAALLEFAGAFFFGSHVSATIQKGIIYSDVFTQDPRILVYGMFASLLATGMWLQIASSFGLPVSTTHAIVGSLVGFGAVLGGWRAIKWSTVVFIVSSWVLSPLMGGCLAYYLFSLLRKKIFYSFNPVREAQKLTPILVFFLTAIFAHLLIFDEIQQWNFEHRFFPALGISLFVGLLGALISHLCVRRISIHPSVLQTRPHFGPEIPNSLEKARKHLMRIRSSSTGNLKYKASLLIEEIDNLSTSLQKNIEKEVTHSEYASVERIFGYLQILSASLMAFAHGANDVANAIGPLAAATNILNSGVVTLQATTPTWTLLLGGGGIVIGLATWGWRVIETIGKKITELTPTRGFTADFGAAATILIASRLGMPISTTHTLVGAVIGVGLARGIEALNIGMTRDIVLSWIITIPAGAILAIASFYGIQCIFG